MILDAYNMWRDEKVSRYVMEPYLLQDEHGVFTIGTSAWLGVFFPEYHKTYQTGDLAGQKVQIGGSEFDELKDEAHALWGHLDWKGDFVPGLLRPRLPVVCIDCTDG